MFDIGFWELALIFVIGLVVLGPKRLPIAIRTVMGWVRTLRGLAANVQNELAQELKLQELQESIKKAEALNLSRLSPELEKTVNELKASAEKMKGNLENSASNIQPLTEEQVAQVQARIAQDVEKAEQEIQLAESDLQKKGENAPLVNEEFDLCPAEIAELGEADEQKLSAYYPPDDDLADNAHTPKDKSNVR